LLKDISALTIEGVAGFVYPKAKGGEDLYFFDKLLETVEYEKGLPIGTFRVVPLIETAAAVLNAQEICLASDRVIAIAYGCEDFVADLQGVHDHEGRSLFTPRALIAMAARATGVIPIDTVHINVHDLEELEENIKIARILGFEGMLILHPKELELAHRYFSPSEEEVEHADKVLELHEKAKKMGKGVAILDQTFIGPPMVIAAKKSIERHELIKRREMSRT
jgi:citrate lyase subunit beta/citryl-CoA lyase